MLALSVGFTTNVLNVVRYGARVVLNNGYHRALALQELGVTHVPCLIQVCAHWEDVVAGSSEMYDNGLCTSALHARRCCGILPTRN